MTYSKINETLLGTGVNRKINENLLFNTKLLEECRKHSERIETKLQKYGGKLIKEELDLYDLSRVHPVGKPLINQKTKKVDYPNGLQIRSNMITDNETVDLFKDIIAKRTWNPRRNQIILIQLPEEYQYFNDDGFLVTFGIIDGNHRVDAASLTEEFIIAWLIDMPLNKIRKYGNAVCNKVDEAVLGRSDDDIIESVLIDLKDKTTDLCKNTKRIEEETTNEDQRQKLISELWKEEINDYDVHHKKAEALLRKLQWKDSGFVIGSKPWDADRIKVFIEDECEDSKSWTPTPEEKYYDYTNAHGHKIIVTQAEGNNHVAVVYNRANILEKDPNAQVFVYAALAKKFKSSDPEKIANARDNFITSIKDATKKIAKSYKLLHEDDISPLTRFGYLPQNSQELEGNNLIKRD